MSKFEFAGLLVGMTADEAIRLLKPRGMMAVRSGWIGKNEHGLIGKWLFDDGTVITLERTEFPGPYKVSGIEYKKYTQEEIADLDLETMLPSYKLEPEPVLEPEPEPVVIKRKRKRKQKRKRKKA